MGNELSVPFFIRPDAWRRTLPKAVSYHHAQRCGVEVPNVHPVCHLDDARRRDNGQHVDVTGGWHDAGDLRKWMDATMMNALGLLRLARNLGEKWDLAGSGLKPLYEEVQWGNRYFLKMQDTDGRVWADTAGGVGGDNSDNHWTDNRSGTDDDRYINTGKPTMVQAMFVALQAMIAQAYDKTCLEAATRCWQANKRDSTGTRDLAWWTLAALEMYRTDAGAEYAAAAAELAGRLAGLQNTEFMAGQKQFRGFWRMRANSQDPYNDAVYSAIPGIALLEAAAEFPKHPDASRWRDAVKLHLEEYALPLAARTAYEIVPFGVFAGTPTQEMYRPLAGGLTYRYFMPTRRQNWWLGMTSHLECYAALLAMAARAFGKPAYRDLAYRQLEWVMGGNPFGACLMTGEGMRNPYPHSRYVGLIPGGILNGIAGNAKDEPILDTEYGFDWRTCEYWSPHNAWYLWAHSVLERA
ncbi:MAG: glycoside hydrolase family 9 protein [Acidobacteriia bacterium]|nr:glycoside hydrolase family 9 protein [Terriglobia bacterium]